MTLTPEERAIRRRQSMIDIARDKGDLGKYRGTVAVVFQKAIRAEAAALPAGLTPAVRKGELVQVFREVGQCVCITCSKVLPWTTMEGHMQTGHFIGRCASLLFQEDGVAPQCDGCNKWGDGEGPAYTIWMEAVRGRDTIDRLQKLKPQSRSYDYEELVDINLEFQARLKIAEDQMKGNIQC